MLIPLICALETVGFGVRSVIFPIGYPTAVIQKVSVGVRPLLHAGAQCCFSFAG